jgi:hypothetical protein
MGIAAPVRSPLLWAMNKIPKNRLHKEGSYTPSNSLWKGESCLLSFPNVGAAFSRDLKTARVSFAPFLPLG